MQLTPAICTTCSSLRKRASVGIPPAGAVWLIGSCVLFVVIFAFRIAVILGLGPTSTVPAAALIITAAAAAGSAHVAILEH